MIRGVAYSGNVTPPHPTTLGQDLKLDRAKALMTQREALRHSFGHLTSEPACVVFLALKDQNKMEYIA